VPRDRTLKTLNAIHRVLLKVSGGRVGWRAQKMPVVELTTVGRRSGRAHAVMLTSPVQEGASFVVVASRGGDDQHPAWFLNLRDNPAVEVRVHGGPRARMRARLADQDERARLWPLIAAVHPPYADYRVRTAREIPIVYLEPAAELT
jgi:deazaflavin-dependent oxidoreductase (nitroreductase family)